MSKKTADFEAALCSLVVMNAVSISETSANFYETKRRNILDNRHLHARRRENLKHHFSGCF
jgi:hypothetical protein